MTPNLEVGRVYTLTHANKGPMTVKIIDHDHPYDDLTWVRVQAVGDQRIRRFSGDGWLSDGDQITIRRAFVTGAVEVQR